MTHYPLAFGLVLYNLHVKVGVPWPILLANNAEVSRVSNDLRELGTFETIAHETRGLPLFRQVASNAQILRKSGAYAVGILSLACIPHQSAY
jgi:hypothetical protein